MNKKQTIVFYHLPKTAGTTLNRVFKQNYSPDEMVECGPDTHAFVADFKGWSESKRQRIRLMQGHYPFGLHKLLPQKTICFTLLRDPVERVISYYFHARRDPNHYLYDLIHDNNWSLKELLDSGVALMMNDGQVRLLSAVWGEVGFGEVDAGMLETAVSNLNQCTAVGITEQFDKSLLLFQHHFGWQHIAYTRTNVGKNRVQRDQLSTETIATIQRCNQLDRLLYEKALNLFNCQIKEMGILFPLRVATFGFGQRLRHLRFG